MKVLYVFRSLAHWGGIERVLVEKMNLLVAMYGYEVFMLTTDQGQHPVPYQLEEGVNLWDLGIRFHQQYQYRWLKRVLMKMRLKRLFRQRLDQSLKRIQPDVIVCTTANYVDLDVLIKIKGEIPLVVESHSIYLQTIRHSGLKGRFADYMYHRSLKRAQVIVALTEEDAMEWHRHYPHVRAIPDIVHLNDGGISTLDSKRVIFVGRFDYQKRPMEMLKIWQLVYPKYPDWHLDIYGEGEQQQELDFVARNLNMNIHIHQPTDKILDCFRESSILASTSLYEPFGLVIPEAMSCGIPVVAFDCPYGPSEIITDGRDGFLIDCYNDEAFADKLCLLMENETLRKQMGRYAIQSAQRFKKEKIMPMWNILFEGLVVKS